MLQTAQAVMAGPSDRTTNSRPVSAPADVAAATPAAATATADFMDFRFDLATAPQVLAAIGGRPAAAPFAYVVTPNVDHVIRLRHNRSDLWPAYRHAWLTLCDSRILGRLADRTGVSMPVVPGSDLTAALFRDVIRPNDRIAILGADADTVDALRRRHGLTDIVHYDPPMGFINDPAEVTRAVDFIVGAGARYSLLAIGSPQQEIVAWHVFRRGTGTGIGLCIGASLDFLTGRQHRAPVAMQRLSLEWAYRLLSNPRRLWRRYLIDGPMIFRQYRHWRSRAIA